MDPTDILRPSPASGLAEVSSGNGGLSRRAALRRLAAGLGGAILSSRLFESQSAPQSRLSPGPRAYRWINQTDGPRPPFVWENCEDLFYDELPPDQAELTVAPEFCAFTRRAWVFNRAMRWLHPEPEGAIICYSSASDLLLTGIDAVSTWHSDPDNGISTDAQWTTFTKRSALRRRECTVMPALQFHLGHHPTLEVEVKEADADWQFVVSIKGRTGPPFLSSGWRKGPGTWQVNIASALRARGYSSHFAELHFVLGLWPTDAASESVITYRARLIGQAALVGSLPVVRSAQSVAQAGAPICAVVVEASGRLADADKVHVRAELPGRTVDLAPQGGMWKASFKGLQPGDYEVKLTCDGAVTNATSVQLRVTDGQFDRYDSSGHWITRNGKPLGPLTGSYQGAFFFRDVGIASALDSVKNKPEKGASGSVESLVNGQTEWDAWDRVRGVGEHQHFWEALTSAELEQRFLYLQQCGWDVLQLAQHRSVFERLDAGGRIAPHGAEQLALYLRLANRHGLRCVQALTSGPYIAGGSAQPPVGTVPYSRYLDEGFEDADFRQASGSRFEPLFQQYIADFLNCFGQETALLAISASGDGDSAIGKARVRDISRHVKREDPNHLFLSEPVRIMDQLPSKCTAGWPGELWGATTEGLGREFPTEFDLGVEFKFYQMGHFYQAGGNFAVAPHYLQFRERIQGRPGSEPWTGTVRYRRTVRDTLYLGLVHRIPLLLSTEEQVAEDEHRILREARGFVDWAQSWIEPEISVTVDSSSVIGEGRARLGGYERAFGILGLTWRLVAAGSPGPQAALATFDAREPFVQPRFKADGGQLPDQLRSAIPIRVPVGCCVSWTWSQDRRTLLAYVYNITDHFEIPGNTELPQRFHRRPQAVDFRLRLQNLPDVFLNYRLYDLSRRELVKHRKIRRDAVTDLFATKHDFLVLVTP